MDHNNSCRLHQMSMHCLNMLQSRSNSKKKLIEVDIHNLRKKLIISNRNKLIPIIKTIIFLGRNDIAFRGHCDDSKYHSNIGKTCKNNIGIGNFVELLNFCIEAGDIVLEHHIRSAPKDATYISKTTQNELIEYFGKTIKEVLINKIKKEGYFSILCDGASNCSNVEQQSLVIRYIDCDNVICEDFLWFIECKSGTTGLSLAQNSEANALDVSKVKPRLYGRQIYRDNYPSDTVSDYFKYSITSPILDHLINELEDRFDEGEMVVYKGLSGIPATVVKKK
ncbi:uncharacterized protein LOC136072291 [Hydra vulgaris]|uniref:uncharacterized protein LOC136072291 n=1 Tax=Hydra vulgaris TaxID=6087 RepID=UPI0032EA4A61